MIPYFGNIWKGDFYNFAIGNLNFHARSREGLSGLHAMNGSSYSSTVNSYDFDIVLAVKRCKCRKCLRDFHFVTFSKC